MRIIKDNRVQSREPMDKDERIQTVKGLKNQGYTGEFLDKFISKD